MPELPEVETVRRVLETKIVGHTIEKVDVYVPRIIQDDIQQFQTQLLQQNIIRLERYGKYLVFILSNDVLIIHLRMEGKFYIKKHEPLNKHEHVVFHLDDDITLRYHDVRKFGTMHLRTHQNYRTTYPLNALGPEPKDAEPIAIYKKLHHKHIPVKTALLDQHIMSGLGNIYVDETLFLSRIKPTRKTNKLSKKDVQNLVLNATKVLQKAVSLGGSTIRSYTASLGVHGRFQNELNVHMRQGEACPVCGTTIIKTKVGGRGTYVCPTCQK